MAFRNRNDWFSSGGAMARPKRLTDDPTLLDLYAAMASIGLIQRYGPEALPAFVAKGSFEIAEAMLERRKEIMEKKDEQ